MATERIRASYLIETPEPPEKVAEVMAGEQSCGTFTRVEGETDALRVRARATVESIVELESVTAPSLPNALLERKGTQGPWRRARVEISFPVANIGANLATLAATVSGNLYDLGEVSGLRLETVHVPAAYRARFELPRVGIAGTRSASGAWSGSAQTSSSLMKSTPAAHRRPTSSAVSAAEKPTFGLMMVPTSAPLATPVARRVPAMPTRGSSKRAR